MSGSYREFTDPDCEGETQAECLSFVTRSFIETIRRDGSGRRRLTRCSQSGFCELAAPAFSPNGRRLAFGAPPVPYVPGRPLGVVVARADGARPRSLPIAPGHLSEGQPSWSPDGLRLAFTAALDTPGPDTAIFVVNSDGTGLRRLTSGTSDEDPAWSSRGSIAFTRRTLCCGNRGIHRETYTVLPDGTGLRRLTFGGGGTPAWSPDGTRLAIARYARGGTRVHTLRADGSGLRPVARRGSWQPAWSPDGKRIAFAHGGDIYTVRANGRGLRLVARAPRARRPGTDTYLREPDWQPRP